MILVEPTPQNWEIFSQLCELDAEYRICDDVESRNDIIAKAVEICQNIEVKK